MTGAWNRLTGLLLPAVLLVGGPMAGQEAPSVPPTLETMRRAAVELLDGLGAELAGQASFAMEDDERKRWSNLPAPMFAREGVSFDEMSAAQRLLAHRLIQAPLSSQGYLKVAGVMRVDEILAELSRARQPGRAPIFGQGRYWIGLFGSPREAEAPWGFQLDGHHLALNFTVVGEQISVTPTFLGADPAEIRTGLDAGWYPLAMEDRRGRTLFASLREGQRAQALLPGATPRDVIAGPARADRLKEITGLSAAELEPAQRRLLLELLHEYVGNLAPALAEDLLRRIEAAGVDQLHFAWSGLEPGKPYYYRIHGPAVLIEFDNSYPPGRSSGEVNHIHTVFREPGRDYGDDLLRLHYLESPHHRQDPSGGRASN